MSRLFIKFLLFELAVIPTVVLIFKSVSDRIVAGAMAGTVFVAIGAWIFISGLRDVKIRRSPTFVMACVHLFGVALPMMITRLLNQSIAFQEVKIWGLPGPAFHSLSTGVYFVLLAATLLDAVRHWRKSAAAKN